jgi:NAD-dependent SIR2 family protein deacetylase
LTTSPEIDPRLYQKAAALIDEADGLIVAAGAGMGVDSGLPDFRGNQGFWRAYPALAASGTGFSDVASPAAFVRQPRQAWGFYGHRLGLYRSTLPHAGFDLLMAWMDRIPAGGFVVTSNVDGQFQKAGFGPELIHELHGSIHRLQCLRRCTSSTWSADAIQVDVDEARCLWRGDLPACPHCGDLARPNLLMFGDGDWVEDRYDQQDARLQRWLAKVRRPVVVEIGAGTAIPSVRHFSQDVVRRRKGRLVRINPRDFEVPTRRDVGIPAGAVAALTAIERELQNPT